MTEDETQAEAPEEPTTEPEPTPEPPARGRKQHKEPETVTLTLAAPEWCTSYNAPQADGGTLLVDRRGVEVPAGDAEALIATAATYGVTIRSN